MRWVAEFMTDCSQLDRLELDLSTMQLMNGCRNDDVIQFGPLHSQSDFYVIQSDACFVCTP